MENLILQILLSSTFVTLLNHHFLVIGSIKNKNNQVYFFLPYLLQSQVNYQIKSTYIRIRASVQVILFCWTFKKNARLYSLEFESD